MTNKYNGNDVGIRRLDPHTALMNALAKVGAHCGYSAESLDNHIGEADRMPFREEAGMATRINRTVIVDGQKKWIHANTEQEYADKLAKLMQADVQKHSVIKHKFKTYALNWFNLYSKPNIATVTATTYKRQLDNVLIPAFGEKNVEEITTDDVQALFNTMTGAKSTKDKCKVVLNMILDAAIEDGYIVKNPLKSKRFKITGAASEFTKEYSVEQMRFLVRNLDKVQSPTDRAYQALQALHPLRLEEVLGLKWEDVDTVNRVIHIRRAVTHPTRNQPEVKTPKTEASIRDIGLSSIAAERLMRGADDEYVIGGKNPMSYTQVRRMCERIQKDTGFEDKITPIRFRTTVLTDIYDRTKDVKAAQAAAGHTTSAMTLKHYVKGRNTAASTANAIDEAYGA